MPSKFATTAVIMAGGKGTRLAPYSTILPKPLMPVDDQPILEVVIRQLKHHGFRRIVISVGHLAELIMAFFNNGKRWGVEIEYAIEDEPQGTMGCLRAIELPDEPVLVMNGDVLTDIDYRNLVAYHVQKGAMFTIGAVERHVDISLGVLDYDEGCQLTGFREKPKMTFVASMGIYVLDPVVRQTFPLRGAYGFDQLMLDLLANGTPPTIYPFKGYWLDMGRPEDFEAAVATFQKARERFLPQVLKIA